MQGNTLYRGDNLDILRRYIPDESVDLIYLDPPFNSNQAYNVIFEENNGSGAAAQIEAFDDTWHWTMETIEAYQDVVETAGPAADALVAFRQMLGETDMMAYLAMMAPRLIELRRVLKETGSIYLHCDPVASHYLKVLMDAVFGGASFQNEIIWHYHTGGASKRRFSRKHDTVYMYSVSGDYVFNTQREAYREEHTDHFTETDKEGRTRRGASTVSERSAANDTATTSTRAESATTCGRTLGPSMQLHANASAIPPRSPRLSLSASSRPAAMRAISCWIPSVAVARPSW